MSGESMKLNSAAAVKEGGRHAHTSGTDECLCALIPVYEWRKRVRARWRNL